MVPKNTNLVFNSCSAFIFSVQFSENLISEERTPISHTSIIVTRYSYLHSKTRMVSLRKYGYKARYPPSVRLAALKAAEAAEGRIAVENRLYELREILDGGSWSSTLEHDIAMYMASNLPTIDAIANKVALQIIVIVGIAILLFRMTSSLLGLPEAQSWIRQTACKIVSLFQRFLG